MLNVHLIYRPPSSWRILFWYGGYPRQFSHLKKIRSLVVPGGGCRKGVFIQGSHLKRRFSCGISVIPEKKRDVTGVSIHAPRQRNIRYMYMFRWYIYKSRRLKHPHFPIIFYRQRPQGPASRPHYRLLSEVLSWRVITIPFINLVCHPAANFSVLHSDQRTASLHWPEDPCQKWYSCLLSLPWA